MYVMSVRVGGSIKTRFHNITFGTYSIGDFWIGKYIKNTVQHAEALPLTLSYFGVLSLTGREKNSATYLTDTQVACFLILGSFPLDSVKVQNQSVSNTDPLPWETLVV